LLVIENGAVSERIKNEILGTERKKLFPTDIGIVVNDFLVEHFGKILNFNFTADVEAKFDDIADGKLEWREMIRNFYTPFHSNIEETLEHSDRASGERVLGVDEKTGKEVITRIGRYGPMVQIGKTDDEEKPRFASLLKEQSIQTITFEEAMKLFILPRTLGATEDGEEIAAAIGRFGPYVRVGKTFASIPKDADFTAYDITLEQGLEIYKAKLEADANKFIKSFPENEDYQVLNGRWGPYIKAGKKNVKIPKDVEPKDLTLEDCIKLAEAAPAKKPRGKAKAKKK